MEGPLEGEAAQGERSPVPRRKRGRFAQSEQYGSQLSPRRPALPLRLPKLRMGVLGALHILELFAVCRRVSGFVFKWISSLVLRCVSCFEDATESTIP